MNSLNCPWVSKITSLTVALAQSGLNSSTFTLSSISVAILIIGSEETGSGTLSFCEKNVFTNWQPPAASFHHSWASYSLVCFHFFFRSVAFFWHHHLVLYPPDQNQTWNPCQALNPNTSNPLQRRRSLTPPLWHSWRKWADAQHHLHQNLRLIPLWACESLKNLS